MNQPNLFALAEQCLFTGDIESKLSLTHAAWQACQSGRLALQNNGSIRPIAQTSFPARPNLLPPRDMPKRRMDTPAGLAAFFHALTHIEFVAIYLAWDIIYRFRNLPETFYRDWLRIADEEAQHFTLLRRHLQEMDVDYGDLPAHRNLWGHAEDTADDVLARLAIVPRCMEARGLDVTPAMIEKFKTRQDFASVAILSRIFNDEIGHVERGCHWFKWVAESRKLDPEQAYKKLILGYYKGKPKGPFNREVRIIAGFSHQEIDWLEGLHD